MSPLVALGVLRRLLRASGEVGTTFADSRIVMSHDIERTDDAAGRRRTIAIVAIAAGFGALTMWLASSLNIWQDEWYSLRTTSRDLRFAWTTAIGFEGIPPLYPLVLDLWRHINDSVFFARLLSIVCVAGAAIVGARIAHRWMPRAPAVAVAGAIAFNAFSIYAAVEIRLYAMALLLSAAIVATFFDAFVDERARARDVVAFVAVSVVAIYVQYFDVALLIGGALALASLRRGRALGTYAITMVVVALACSPIALFIREQLGVPRSLDASSAGIVPLAETVFAFALPHDALANWFSDRRNLAYDAGVLAIVVAIVAAKPRLSIAAQVLGSFVLAGFAFYPIAATIFHQTFLFPRHAVVLVVPVLLLVVAIIDATRVPALPMRLYFGIYALCSLAALVVTYRGLAKPGDFARASTFLRSHVHAGARIYAFDQEMVGPLAYYDRDDRIIPLPQAQDFARFDASQFRLRSDQDVRDRMGPVAPGAHVLLYRGDVCYDPADQFGCRFLEDVVRADYRTVASRDLRSANVRELIHRTSPSASGR